MIFFSHASSWKILKIKYIQVDQENIGLKEYGDLLNRLWMLKTHNLNFLNVMVQSAKNRTCHETRDSRPREVYSMRSGYASRRNKMKQGVGNVGVM